MSPIAITCKRTLGVLKSLYSTVLAYSLFFAAAGASFAFSLEAAEGGETPIAVIWAIATAPLLPILASLLAMDVWSDEKRTGRIEQLLCTPVLERDFTIGKFLGVLIAAMTALGAFLISTIFFLYFFAPSALENQTFFSFLPALMALAMQSTLWCAVAVAASAAFRHAAAAAITTIAITSAIPRGLWLALMQWAPQGRLSFGEMPLDAQIFDITNGSISSATVLSYALLSIFSLFIATKFTTAARYIGRGARQHKWSMATVVTLTIVLSVMLLGLFYRLNTTIELPIGIHSERIFSEKTRTILRETRGEITISAFMSRKDSRFRQISYFLRALSREADAVGGARINIRYVDPRWDLGAAGRLVNIGADVDSLVFERGRRQTILPLGSNFSERRCANALQKIAMPPQRKNIYWTRGHGECPFEAYGPWGMSDIARELHFAGYHNQSINLAQDSEIPSDCALVIVAGPKSDFSKTETGRLDTYLRKGGRLLLLFSGEKDKDWIAKLLTGWGIAIESAKPDGVKTQSGTDVIVSDFSDHPITDPIRGRQILLEAPTTFSHSSSSEAPGADKIEYFELAKTGDYCVAAVSERGSNAGEDLELRPTRIVAIGDASFIMNAQLKEKGNENRVFFLNSVAYLSGSGAMTGADTEASRLITRMDRSTRIKFVFASSAIFPGILFIIAMAIVIAGRKRS